MAKKGFKPLFQSVRTANSVVLLRLKKLIACGLDENYVLSTYLKPIPFIAKSLNGSLVASLRKAIILLVLHTDLNRVF